ncbi:putative suppressive immunomodulating factor [Leishmania major strain Friedlin]|uniref:Putative suppressive immunomodulating factor n=1 Tax=Leishmania major TaxID=5664 RepID=Q4QI55_LEIMA|nr:putative suppressive immunomodulating factor [Leishmania major strain Friedlin]CAG9569413.1 suppressive_immunomodulating_factor_-_putative [Leishmania major strain Friedlin]CAJ02294.1 putative suppressive immunomodulating factor [Leishmania major strain Friedlin]|eukprot:XP_001681143.1 putative suppressive immunomodulating factor [Leishmania major strain Friedlin]
MTSLTLREIGVINNVAEDHDVLELFAACRESVVHVAASHLLPDHVAVTTRNGFVELIDTATGEFRLFLTYLDRIPLDASLRCFSLVPSLHAASPQHHHRHRQHHLLYSLSYSNELLLGNVETGAVRVFATCESRPSVVQCDGDYIICGEGTGQVTVWRTTVEEEWDARYASCSAASTSLLPPLWKTRLFDSTVVCANLHRDQLVCCSADYRCVVACAEDGVVRATLPLDLDQAVAVFALTMPSMTSLLHKSLVVCFTSRISIFTSRPARGTAASAQLSLSSVPTAEHLECWTRQGDCVVGREEVACASCLGGYLAAGTISGLVLLYFCGAAESLVKELVRFNVGYGVTGMQLLPNDTLLVVTSVGDVWRWPLCDLLRNADASGAEGEKDEATEAEPTAAAHQPPLPLAAPRVPAAPSPQDKTLHTEPRVPATPEEVSYTQEGDTEDRSFSAHDTSTLAHTPQREREATARVEEIVTAVRVGADVPLVGARSDAEEQGTPSVHLSTASASLRALSASSENDGDEDHPDERGNDNTDMDARRAEPATVSCLPPPPPLASPTVSDKFEEKRGVGGVTRCATEFQRRTLYDPEQSTEEPGVVDMGVPSSAAGNSADLSHDGLRIAVSPPSTADNTAHHDAVLEDSGADVPEVAARGSAAGAAAVAAKEGTISDKHIQPFQRNHGDLSDTADVAQGTAHSSPGITSRQGTGMKAAVDDLEHEFAHAMKRLLGPTVGVEGLRKDRRMNPRKVAGVLANLTNQQAAAAGAKGLSYEAPSQPRALEGPNSTKLLEEKRTTLEAAVFDFEAYRQAHRLEVDALQYHHPVPAPTYTLQDRVFDAVESAGRLCDKEAGRATGAAGNAAATLPAAPEDELRDVTYGKVKWTLDPQIAEERRRGGPEMAQHHCDHLIFSTPYPAKATVLFAEEAPLMPSTAWEEVLLLPLPLPPAPSVF